MRAFLFCLAILGLCVSVAVHVATFCGIDPQQVYPWVWMLHVGIFSIWFPAILFTNRRVLTLPKSEQRAAMMSGTPRMMRAVLGPLFAYTAFNFFFTIFVLQGGHSPKIRDGTLPCKIMARSFGSSRSGSITGTGPTRSERSPATGFYSTLQEWRCCTPERQITRTWLVERQCPHDPMAGAVFVSRRKVAL